MELSPLHATDSPTEKISGFVLAGGSSSRMGRDKVLLPWQGKTLLDHAANRLRQVCETVKICSNRTDLPSGERLIPDAIPESGPLGGIVAALEQSQTKWNLFLAVDLPLVPVEFLHGMIAREKIRRKHEGQTVAVIPEIDGVSQPLCALYHRNLAPGLRSALAAGKHKIMVAVQESVTSLELPPSSIDVWKIENFPTARNREVKASELFLNINTPMDWWRAQELASK